VFRDAGRLTLVFEDLIQNAVQVDRHGGTIAVGNHPAGGALVTVRLPVRSAARASA
jgi:signal transduction histidine kinase